MPNRLTFTSDPAEVMTGASLLVVGRKSQLGAPHITALLPDALSADSWRDMVDRNDPGDSGRAVTTYTGGRPMKVVAGLLPDVCSRHNAPSRAWAVPKLVRATRQKGTNGVLVALESSDHAYALATAIAQAVPLYTSISRPAERTWTVCLMTEDGPVTDLAALTAAARATQTAAQIVDTPPNELNTNALVSHGRQLADRYDHVQCTVIAGEALSEAGLHGLYCVGKAAIEPPALVVLDYVPEKAIGKHIAWIGKGIVYDTGGLSMKTKASMPGMKTDLGGAAAVVAAFEAVASLRAPIRLTAVLCVAENAVGPTATRPDDIVRMYSGRTVEINNTDAEGRLVLADGLAWTARNRQPDVMIDIATLTGAQSVATGKHHAALYSSDEELETQAVQAGKASGNLVHPVPFCPEYFRSEFTSQVADMKNSVKHRNNAQSSCAGQFLHNHLTEFDGPWLHVDMAGPVLEGGRASGYGPALLLTLAGVGAKVPT